MPGSRLKPDKAADQWGLEEVSKFYTKSRAQLTQYANRITRDSFLSEELVQDAFIKFMLAAPAISNTSSAEAYLKMTIRNLAIDKFRYQSRRPNLIALDEYTNEIETEGFPHDDLADELSVAEDSAIIRQALSLLSPAERAALLMWEIDGKSIGEIADHLGIKESNVKHTLSRARKSLRRILSEYVIDDSKGLTALDVLSITYRKASQISRASSKAVMSLVLIISVYFGLNAFDQRQSDTIDGSYLTELNGEVADVSVQSYPTPSSISSVKAVSKTSITSLSSQNTNSANLKKSIASFFGLDDKGNPNGFNFGTSEGVFGEARVFERSAVSDEVEISSSTILRPSPGSPNILLVQKIQFSTDGLRYSPVLSVGISGAWSPLNLKPSFNEYVWRNSDGNYVIDMELSVEGQVETNIVLPSEPSGIDFQKVPKKFQVRILLDPTKTIVLGQAISAQ